MNKWETGILWLFFTLLLAPFFKGFIDVFTNTTDGIMVVGDYAEYCSADLVAFVGVLPWILPVAVVIGTIIMWAKPEKKRDDDFRF